MTFDSQVILIFKISYYFYIDLDWLQSFKQFFINVPYHILVVCLTLVALFKNVAIRVKLAKIYMIWHIDDFFLKTGASLILQNSLHYVLLKGRATLKASGSEMQALNKSRSLPQTLSKSNIK